MADRQRRAAQRLVFLIGSGASIPSGLPKTAEITRRVMSGVGMMRDTQGGYRLGKPLYSESVDSQVQKVLAFIGLLAAEARAYYGSAEITYEEIHDLAAQVRDSHSGDHDNPAIHQFVVKLNTEAQALVDGQGLGLAAEATNYIEGAVCASLVGSLERTVVGLDLVVGACRESLAGVDILTLNHDLLLEAALDAASIDYADGFGGDKTDSIREWAPDVFDHGATVRLLKLHGSVDWFKLEPDVDPSWFSETVARVRPKTDIDHAEIDGLRFMRAQVLPIFLAGTFGKMRHYTRGVFAELHFRLYESLRRADRLVVCGYGFRDQGINNQIINWVFAAPERRQITVIHGQPAELKATARRAIRNNWDEWKRRQILRILQEWIEDVNWSTIKAML